MELPLVINQQTETAYLMPAFLKQKQEVSLFLHHHFPSAYQRLQDSPTKKFMYIQRHLTAAQLQCIQQAQLKDIILLQEPQRFYPYEALAPIIGIINYDNQGLFGLESMYNAHLSGVAGTMGLYKDGRSHNLYFKSILKQAAQPGKDVQLTLDSSLQFLIFEEVKKYCHNLNATYGGVLVIDPAQGDILAMVNYPSFEPNNTQSLCMDNTANRICTDAYELGSIMKTVTALALLEEKLASPYQQIDCKNNTTAVIKGVTVNTLKPHGLLSFSEIIQLSNNIGMASLALRLQSLLYEHYKRLGFGQKTNLYWPGQQSGFVNNPDHWSKSSVISLSFGYEVRSTLLQLAHAWCILARGGKPIDLRLTTDTPIVEYQACYSQESIEQLIAMLEKTVQQGTAHHARLVGYKIWGKTGTANLLVEGSYSKVNNIYTFAGVIEKDSYKRLVITCIKDIGRGDVYASSIAVPLFSKVVNLLIVNGALE